MTKSWTKGYEMDDAEKLLEQDVNQEIITHRGIFVLPTGLELEVVETSGSPNNYVQINTGKAWVEDTLGEITSTQQVQISGVTVGGKARIDAIYIDSGTNQVGKIVGVEATSGSEKPPDIPEDKCILAFVVVTDTEPPTVNNAEITDRRFFGYYVESDLIGVDAITESKITFDDSTGHTHAGTGSAGTKIPEANVTMNVSTGHDHDGGDSKVVDHVDLANKGTKTHAQIDTHIVDVANPHVVTEAQILANSGKYYLYDSISTYYSSPLSTTSGNWINLLGLTVDYFTPIHGLEPDTEIYIEAIFFFKTDALAQADFYLSIGANVKSLTNQTSVTNIKMLRDANLTMITPTLIDGDDLLLRYSSDGTNTTWIYGWTINFYAKLT